MSRVVLGDAIFAGRTFHVMNDKGVFSLGKY